MKQHIPPTYMLVLTVRNNQGILVRCAQIFSRRGHSIKTLHVTAIPGTPHLSLMTITAEGSPIITRQIILQLKKLIDVIDITEKDT